MATRRTVNFGNPGGSAPLLAQAIRNPLYSFGAQTLSDATEQEPVLSTGYGLTKLARALIGGASMGIGQHQERTRQTENFGLLARAIRSNDPAQLEAAMANPDTAPFALQLMQQQAARNQPPEGFRLGANGQLEPLPGGPQDPNYLRQRHSATQEPWVVAGDTILSRSGLRSMYGQPGGQPQGMPSGMPQGGQPTPGAPNPSNPGNMRVPGQTAFQTFNTPEEGVAAMVSQLQRYGQRGLLTPLQIVSRWAPRGDGANNPEAYAAAIQQIAGLDPNQPVDMANPEVMARLVAAMAQVEQGRPLDPNILQRGVQMAYGAPSATSPQGQVARAPLAPPPGIEAVPPQAAAVPTMTDAAPPVPQPGQQMAQAQPPRIPTPGAPSTGLVAPRPTISQVPGVGPTISLPRSPQAQVTIDQRAGQAMVELDRDRLRTMQEAAANDRRQLAMFDRLERALRTVPEGTGAQWLPAFGQAARAIGIDIPGTSEAEVVSAIQSILTGLARPPGSGATSDFEQRLYMQAVPRLGNTREGNMQMIDMGRRLMRRRLQEVQLARTIMRRDGNLDQLDEAIEALGPVFGERDMATLTATVSEPGAAPQQGDAAAPQRMVNPQTGEMIELRNGQWVPVR